MPRRSTASTTGAATHAAGPSMMSASASTTAPSNLDGDTSILSAATTTDVSPSSRGAARTSTKADKADGHADGTGIDDLLLPRTLTSRLARGTLPPNTSIQKDALLALTKAASVFISYLASQANELTTKKTIAPQDVLKALKEMEMGTVMGLGEVGPDGNVVGGRLERELEAWETVVRGKRKGYREKVKQRESGVGSGAGGGSEAGDGDGGSNKEGDGEGDERRTKRARVEEGADEGAGRTEDYHDATSVGGGQSTTLQHQSQRQPRTNGTPKDGQARDDLHNDEGGDGDTYYDDETQPDDEGDDPDPDPDPEDEQDDDEDEEEDEDPAPDDEEELENGGYGPDDQLRHDMNHGGDDVETADESD